MKKRYLTHHVILALSMLLFIATPSCTNEDFPTEKGNGFILVSLNNTQLRAESLFANEDLIEKIRVLVFLNGDIEKNEVFISGNTNFSNPFQIEVKTGTKEVYVIANETAGLTSALAVISSVSQLKGLLAETINSPLSLPLMMIGNMPSVTVMEGQPNISEITLKRIAAKIQLLFRKETTDNVIIKKVSLFNNTEKSGLIDGAISIPDANQNYWSYISATDNMILNADATSFPGSEVIYVYENLTGGIIANATQVEVEASYNGVDTKYRVYVNENISSFVNAGNPGSSVSSPNDHLYAIKRNYAYVLTGTITGMGEFDGLNLETNVLPWKKVSSSILYDWILSITPQPTFANHTFTMDASNQISFTFNLTNPIGASWTANLTNEVDFEITSIRSGIANQQVTITIQAKKAPSDAANRETAFYISALLDGNFSELPLISGSSLIGEGNRVKIIQPISN